MSHAVVNIKEDRMSAIWDSLAAQGNRKATIQLMKSEQGWVFFYSGAIYQPETTNKEGKDPVFRCRKVRWEFHFVKVKVKRQKVWLFTTQIVLIMGFLGGISLWDSLQGIPTHPQVTRVSFCMNSKFPGFSPADVWKYNFTHHQQKVCVWKTFVRNLLKIPAHTGGPVCSN